MVLHRYVRTLPRSTKSFIRFFFLVTFEYHVRPELSVSIIIIYYDRIIG